MAHVVLLALFLLLTVSSPLEALQTSMDSFVHIPCHIGTTNDHQVNLIYLEDIDEDLLECLFTAYQPLIILSLDNFNGIREPSSIHFLTIAANTQKRLAQTITISQSMRTRKHLTKFILSFKTPCEKYLEFIFKAFWRNGFLNIIVLCNTNQQMYTFEPFTEDGFKIVKLAPTIEVFYDKLKNLHLSQVRVSQFFDPIRSVPVANSTDFRGVDADLSKTIIHQLNGTLKFVVPPNDELYGIFIKGKPNGALKDVVSGATHIGWNARFIDHITIDMYEYIYPVGTRYFMHLVVPKAGKVPQYLNFIRIFTPLSWCLLYLTYFLTAFLFNIMTEMALKLRLLQRKRWSTYKSVLEMFYRISVGDTVTVFFKHSSLRQFLISWIFFCYVINTVYIAKLGSVYIHPEYEQDIDSLGDMSRYEGDIYSHPSFPNIIKTSVDPKVYAAFMLRYRRLSNNYDAEVEELTKISNNGHAFMLRRDRANVLIARTFDRQAKRPQYHLVKEYLISMPMTYILTKGSPFLEKFEQMVVWCYEHGLMMHWEGKKNFIKESNTNDKKEFGEELTDDEETIVLTMDVLQGVFYFWIFGIIGACFVFSIELVYWTWHGDAVQLFVLKPTGCRLKLAIKA